MPRQRRCVINARNYHDVDVDGDDYVSNVQSNVQAGTKTACASAVDLSAQRAFEWGKPSVAEYGGKELIPVYSEKRVNPSLYQCAPCRFCLCVKPKS